MNIIKLTCFALAVAFKLETVESKDCGGAPGWEHACIFDHYTDKIRKKVCELDIPFFFYIPFIISVNQRGRLIWLIDGIYFS
jgi:hypothetical protein